jgi:hypothetical protein
MMKPMSDYAKKKEMDRSYRHYLKTVDTIPDFINKKLARMPNNKGYIWRDIHCYGTLRHEPGEPVVMFEKRGNTLIIYETSDDRHRVYTKVGNDRKVLAYDTPRRRTTGGATSIMDYCTEERAAEPQSTSREEGWIKPKGRTNGRSRENQPVSNTLTPHSTQFHDKSRGKDKGKGKGKGKGGSDHTAREKSYGKGRVEKTTQSTRSQGKGSQGKGSQGNSVAACNPIQGPRNPKPSVAHALQGVWANNTIL